MSEIEAVDSMSIGRGARQGQWLLTFYFGPHDSFVASLRENQLRALIDTANSELEKAENAD